MRSPQGDGRAAKLRYVTAMTRTDPHSHLARVVAAQAGADQPGRLFAALEVAMGEAIGHRLFTIMRHDAGASRNRRVHSSNPAAYPVSGYKPVNWEHPWAKRLLLEGRHWIGRDAGDIAWAYPDHEKIVSLGLESAMNLPVRWAGRILGTVNLLHGAGHYDEALAQCGLIFAALAAPALLSMDAD